MMSGSRNSVMPRNLVAANLLLLVFLSIKSSIACPEIEKQSLLTFKRSLQDPGNLLCSWTIETDCCQWKGVFCSSLSSGHVTQLHLENHDTFQGLRGKLNPSLLDLKHLRHLDLSQNYFRGTIPSFIGSMTSLRYLNLSNAGFSGRIPPTIGNLSNLHTLHLGCGSLEVGSLGWLSGLSMLEYLNMNNVDLSKASNWAEVIPKLPSLVELHLLFCRLNSDPAFPLDEVNVSRSKLAIVDLSCNYLMSVPIMGKWVFRLPDLIYLDLSYNAFEGPMPAVANSTKFQHIDLSGNTINSTIPGWLYLCKDLRFLGFGGNRVRGEISNAIANLTSLTILDFSGNELSGEIPREIGNLCHMQKLAFEGNKLQGDISYSFGNLSDCFLVAMETLKLSDNQLSGHMTHQFGEFSSLQTLELDGNLLSGVIPTNIGNLVSLEILLLDSNKLVGNLPESMGMLSNLTYLSIENNKLEGVVSESHFSHMSNLNYFYASQNNLTLKIGQNWVPPFKLEVLGLGFWNVGDSSIPTWLETQKNSIQELDLSYTGISEIPDWAWSIDHLNLSHNQLHGAIPLSACSSSYVYLSSNKLSGPLPQIRSTVIHLDLSDNLFSGGISHFLCHTMTDETYELQILHLGGNCLSGEVPNCWTKWPVLTILSLGNNNFSGRIPKSIGFLANLQSLNLYSNKFSGGIPSSIRNCTRLVMIDLADNNLDGRIQTWPWTSLSQLKFLILRSNKFSGEITSPICKLTSLQILDLSNNRLSGVIPECINNFTAMALKRNLSYDLRMNDQVAESFEYSYNLREFIESASVTIKGVLVHYSTILPLVTIIDLSKNNFSGDIPKHITSLKELVSLNLSRNHLTGPIPSSIGNLKQLESLDLSRNSLSGQIPDSFKTLFSLSYLNLSHNKLTGKIPESTQLQSFNESCFAGNSFCGPPLTISCRKYSKGPGQEDNRDQEDDEWLYIFASLGYTVGISGFFTTLFLMKPWKKVYFELLENLYDDIYVYVCVKWRRLNRSALLW